MPDPILYCDRCGRIITPNAKETAVVGREVVFCELCARDLTPDQKAAIVGADAAPRAQKPSSPRPSTDSSVSRRKEQRSGAQAQGKVGSGSSPAAIALAAIVLIGITVAFVLAGDGKTGDRTIRSASDAPSPTRPSPSPAAAPRQTKRSSDARKRLEEIRAMADADLTRYAELSDSLIEFAANNSDLPEGDEADRFRRELVREYERLADNALNEAAAGAHSLAKGGKYDEAVEKIRSVGERFTEGSWFTMRGEAAIGVAVAEIKGMKTRTIAGALVEARAAFAAGSFDEMRAALRARDDWPEENRNEALRLIAEADACVAENERRARLAAASKTFLLDVVRAGGAGIAAVERIVERDGAELAELGSVEDVERVENRIRLGNLTESLAVDGYRGSGRRVRIHWGNKPISGKVIHADRTTIRLMTSTRREIDIPFVEIRLEDVLAAAHLLEGATAKPLQAAEYVFLRGAIAEAEAMVAALEDDQAIVLRNEIERVDSLLKAAHDALPAEKTPAETPDASDAPAANTAAEIPAWVTRDLVAYWALDEERGSTAADATGRGHTGELKGTVWRPDAGRFGGAAEFDGIDDRIEVAASPDFSQQLTDNWSISVWARVRSTNRRFQGLVTVSRDKAPWYGLWTNSGRWTVGDGGPGAQIEWVTWQHVVLVRDGGARTWTIYVNGNAVGTRPSDERSGLGSIWLGGAASTDEYASGWLDEVRIYRRALSAEEVARLHKYTPPPAAKPQSVRPKVATAEPPEEPAEGPPERTELEYVDVLSGLIGYWPLDEGQGEVSADRSRGGKNATFKNGAAWAVGLLGEAVALDGIDDYVEIEASESHALNAGSFTVSVWTDSAREGILLCRGHASGKGWRVWSRKWFFHDTEWNPVEVHTDKNIEGVWAQLAVAYDSAAKKMTAYLDGSPLATSAVAIKMADIDAGKDMPLLIGIDVDLKDHFFPGRVDELRIYNRCLSPEEVKSVHMAARQEAKKRMLDVVAKRIAKIGGAIAENSAFDESLRSSLSEEAGYSFAKRLGLASNNMLPATVRTLLASRLSREKPQVVRICFDARQLARVLNAQVFEDDLTYIVHRSLQMGVTPVLYTIPVRTPDSPEAKDLTEDLNFRIARAADRAGLYMVDAYTILNADHEARFSGPSKLTAQGYTALNDEFLKMLRKLEESGFGRRPQPDKK